MRCPKLCYRKWGSLLVLLLVVYCYVVLSFVHVINLTPSERCGECSQASDVIKLPAASVNKKSAKEEPAASETRAVAKNNATLVNETLHFVTEDKFKKIDWNDYEFMVKDAAREGPGEQGTAFVAHLSNDEEAEKKKLFNKYNFNAFASDRISFERSIGDLRTEGCKKQQFLRDIPADSVSVVTVFHNERNSTLLRTVHGIINRSPSSLLREIILVDDLSTAEEVKAPLDEYIAQHFPKVRVIRNQERLGLIKSRMVGAAASSGRFLIFLDAHVEVNHNFLPPLLEPMVLDYRTVTCPMVDFITAETFQVHPLKERVRGGFDWDLVYKRLPANEMDETTPHPSPVMVGCAFAITRQWWDELGQYDPGLEIWGGEQYELSFKSWQCGGSVVDAPCSRVAHLFRPLPYVKEVVNDNIIEKNFLRLATVWMDEYKDFVLERRPLMKNVDPGDLTRQVKLRKKLNCKPFKWFVEEVAPDILEYYPVIRPPSTAWGQIRSKFNSSMCVVVNKIGGYKLGSCASAPDFDHDWRLHIREKWQKCLANPGGKSVFPWECIDIESRPTQNFVWNLNDGHIVNVNTKLCLDVSTTLELHMHTCDGSVQTQAWEFGGYNAALVKETWEKHKSEIFT